MRRDSTDELSRISRDAVFRNASLDGPIELFGPVICFDGRSARKKVPPVREEKPKTCDMFGGLIAKPASWGFLEFGVEISAGVRFGSSKSVRVSLVIAIAEKSETGVYDLSGLVAGYRASCALKMPATAGRVRMPANNRVHSSAALQTHGIWQSAIGYDPYAPNKDDAKSFAPNEGAKSEPKAGNSYMSFQDLLALARITGSNADEARGACKKCGRVGHLTFQCRNFLNMNDDNKEKDTEAVQVAVASFTRLDKLKGSGNKANGNTEAGSEEDSKEEEDESETSDSDVDMEIESVIAKREGKKLITKGSTESSSKKKTRRGDGSEDDDSVSDMGERKKRGRSKKRKSGRRRSSLSEDKDEVRRKRRKGRMRKRDKSSDEEEHRRTHRKSKKDERRRKSHRYTDDSSSDESGDYDRRHRQKSWRVAASSDYQASSSDDSRVGRERKRSAKSSRRHRHKEDDSS
ncbi:hypothetical protein NL676_005991 [Syzygium grande]|nr:hypothetical protein NL676_005991 [Syzygium grande]